MSSLVEEINDADFEKKVLKSDIPVMLDIWAPWCGPCRMVAPVVEELAADYEGKVAFCKINIDENTDIAASYGISSVPTMLFFKNGEELTDKRMIGAMAKEDYENVLEGI